LNGFRKGNLNNNAKFLQETDMKITFWGVRGSIASPGPNTVKYGGNTTCLEIALSDGKTIVIDAGTGIRGLGDELIRRNQHHEIQLLLTHIHWDHIMGFPFFAPLFRNNCHIKLDGSRKGIEGLKRIFSTDFVDGTWPIRFEDLKARIEPTNVLSKGPLILGETKIEAHPLQHPQGGMGFKFTAPEGIFVFLTDNELLEHGWTGSSFDDFVKFCRNADILVHDCQYTTAEIPQRKGWGHSDVKSVARLAIAADVKKLFLFHHDPWRTDAEIPLLINGCKEYFDLAGFTGFVGAAAEELTLEL
jgi:phosphoribosyl 1,2-cyclic phosphodiesterase